ncbi:hypothetical protein CC80DRAFT_489274 [Byssothecium circinans]|uniref:Osmotin, thaumatin-like protein n=1 Tax=Byssothecium circinans TaxID=147558 RepID=A0A6A5U5C3_9PLEO|nr:hypothetical protein CC80DRAFT_489274 [Byssothecium circinans]
MVAYKLAGAAALFSLVSSAVAGNAIIQNNCAYPLTLLSTATNKQSTIAAGARYTEPMQGHHSLKLAKDASKLWAHGITQFEYTLDAKLWYDISFIDCVNGQDGSGCPGWAGGVKMTATGGDCAVADCAPGAYCNKQAYFVPNDNLATKSCGPGQNKGDVTMVLCYAKKAKKSVAGRLEYEVRDVEGEDVAAEAVEEEDDEEDEVEFDDEE